MGKRDTCRLRCAGLVCLLIANQRGIRDTQFENRIQTRAGPRKGSPVIY